MTKEDAEKYIKSEMCKNCSVYLGGGKCSDNCKVIETIKALEQDPILGKIRAEIEHVIDNTYDNTDHDKSLYNGAYKDGLYDALDIIDKYSKEQENENGN